MLAMGRTKIIISSFFLLSSFRGGESGLAEVPGSKIGLIAIYIHIYFWATGARGGVSYDPHIQPLSGGEGSLYMYPYICIHVFISVFLGDRGSWWGSTTPPSSPCPGGRGDLKNEPKRGA